LPRLEEIRWPVNEAVNPTSDRASNATVSFFIDVSAISMLPLFVLLA
jgi:hypothetical protein